MYNTSWRSNRWERKGRRLRQNGEGGGYPTWNGLVDIQTYQVRVFSERAFESLDYDQEGKEAGWPLGHPEASDCLESSYGQRFLEGQCGLIVIAAEGGAGGFQLPL